jgi:hypothetical protein
MLAKKTRSAPWFDNDFVGPSGKLAVNEEMRDI